MWRLATAVCLKSLRAIGLLMAPNLPSDWGKSHFSEFVERGRTHASEIVAAFPLEYHQLVQIDSLFKRVQENLDFTKDWFAALFFLRTHTSFLGASDVALSGLLPEAYMIMRGCLENSLYGLYLARHEAKAKTWLQRNESAQMKKKVRDEFKNSRLLSFLSTVDSRLGKAGNSLYERTIDLGAHPNQLALTTAMRTQQTDAKTEVKIAYISGDPIASQLCLKTTAQVGVFGLSVFRHVFKERFDILGITHDIDELSQGL